MSPDFSQKTVDALAKRAAYLCSNPDCRVSTVGPNLETGRATVIGEAAHIFGARPDGARFDMEMTDATRSEITNGLWLCRNCHGKVDRDPNLYGASVLFAWREQHEKHVTAKLGNANDHIRSELETEELKQFDDYPALIRRIVLDKPLGWQWRLTAELMRYLNKPCFRRLRDLRDGLYARELTYLYGTDVLRWMSIKCDEIVSLVSSLENVIARISASWGGPDQPASIDEIHHACLLMRDCLQQVIQHEENIYFVRVPEEFVRIPLLFKNALGSQAEKISSVPGMLDEIVALIGTEHSGTEEKPVVIQRTIEFELPENWTTEIQKEMRRVTRILTPPSQRRSSGCAGAVVFSVVILLLVLWLFWRA